MIKKGQVIFDKGGWGYMIIETGVHYTVLCLNNYSVQLPLKASNLNDLYYLMKDTDTFVM